jgi:glucose-6-phosphate isomerase
MAKTDTRKAFADLKAHLKAGAPTDMRKAFARDAKRFETLSAKSDDLLLDYSKCAVSTRTMKLLSALAKAADVEGKRDAMFDGAIINTTEGRAVLHTALRNRVSTRRSWSMAGT